jgi:hypothetical protein
MFRILSTADQIENKSLGTKCESLFPVCSTQNSPAGWPAGLGISRLDRSL